MPKVRGRKLAAMQRLRAVHSVGSPLAVDPSRTGDIRRAFATELVRRFTEIGKSITELVVGQDVFGLSKTKVTNSNPNHDSLGRFAAWHSSHTPKTHTLIFHGTSSANLQSIKEDNALLPGKGKGGDDFADTFEDESADDFESQKQHAVTYIDTDPEVAASYASLAAQMTGSKAVVIALHIPKNRVKLESDARVHSVVAGVIPYSWVKGEYYPSEEELHGKVENREETTNKLELLLDDPRTLDWQGRRELVGLDTPTDNGYVINPAVSEAQRRYLNMKFGHQWVRAHHFDNSGPLPKRVKKKKRRRRARVSNRFCATGVGGGVDPHCGKQYGLEIKVKDSSTSRFLPFSLEAKMEKMFGSNSGITVADLARIAGALPGSRVIIQPMSMSINVAIHHPEYDAHRTIYHNIVYNDDFYAKKTGTGIGTRVLNRQVQEAAEAGLEEIHCTAAGKKGREENGYYTWPRLGYDGDIPERVMDKLVLQKDSPYHGKKFEEVPRNVSGLMRTREGREWWRDNGHTFQAKFDLSEGSLSRRILDEYVEAKERASGASTNSDGAGGAVDRQHLGSTGSSENAFCPTGAGGGVDSSCGPKKRVVKQLTGVHTDIGHNWIHIASDQGRILLGRQGEGQDYRVRHIQSEVKHKGYGRALYETALRQVTKRGGRLVMPTVVDTDPVWSSFRRDGRLKRLAEDGHEVEVLQPLAKEPPQAGVETVTPSKTVINANPNHDAQGRFSSDGVNWVKKLDKNFSDPIYRKARYEMVPLSEIRQPPHIKLLGVSDPDTVDKWWLKIHRGKPIPALAGYISKDGHYKDGTVVIVDGNHRFLALEDKGITHALVAFPQGASYQPTENTNPNHDAQGRFARTRAVVGYPTKKITQIIDKTAAGRKLRRITTRMNQWLIERYGKKTAAAIIAAGQVLSTITMTGTLGVVYVPSPIATVPGLVLAELHHQYKNIRHAAHEALTLTEREIKEKGEKLRDTVNKLWHKEKKKGLTDNRDLRVSVELAAAYADPSPTPEQLEAGNYRKGHVWVHGLSITIETAAGQLRKNKYKLAHHYGYIKRTESEADGDHIDVFLGPDLDSDKVFVVDQYKLDKSFDEHKCMVGFTSEQQAKDAYLANYSKDWRRFGGIRKLSMGQFRAWIEDGDTKNPIVINAGDWEFHTDAAKVQAFQQWLRDNIDERVRGQAEQKLWERFVQQGYERGAGRAFDDTKKPYAKGYAKDKSTDDFYKGGKAEFLKSSFGQPETVNKVKLLAGRVLTDLKGVTDAMAAQMARVLADGLVKGQNPRQIAAELNRVVTGIGIRRANIIARTEVIRAHAEGQLDSLEKLGVVEVGAQVEWSTAGDKRVCPKCRPLNGIKLTIVQARGKIPLHPQCRCCWLPVVPDLDALLGNRRRMVSNSNPNHDKDNLANGRVY